VRIRRLAGGHLPDQSAAFAVQSRDLRHVEADLATGISDRKLILLASRGGLHPGQRGDCCSPTSVCWRRQDLARQGSCPGLRGRLLTGWHALSTTTSSGRWKNVGRINGPLCRIDWTPVAPLDPADSLQELVAWFGEAMFAGSTPLRDGLNLVAKEIRGGPAGSRWWRLLSEFTGAGSVGTAGGGASATPTPTAAWTGHCEALVMP